MPKIICYVLPTISLFSLTVLLAYIFSWAYISKSKSKPKLS